MPKIAKIAKFPKETDLCAAFIAGLHDTWQAYPETAGFDILLIRKEDGFQIGIEAKLKLNAKVICQVAEQSSKWYVTRPGPDCRAVLVPEDASGELAALCGLLGITVIRQRSTVDQVKKTKKDYDGWSCFSPDLPRLDYDGWSNDRWHEFAPAERCHVPAYVPDVICGDKAPVMLTHWKIAAIKIVVTLEKLGYVTRSHFKHYDISMSRWTQGRWISKGDGLKWVKGRNIPDLRAQHPKNYVEIENDFDTWILPEKLLPVAK